MKVPSPSAAYFSHDTGLLILRLTVGGLLLIHGISKLLHFGTVMTWIPATLVAYHLPAFFAYGVIVGEIVAPSLLVMGLFTRIGAVIVIINMIFAIVLVRHGPSVFLTLNGKFGGWTLQPEAFFLLASLSLVFLRGGKYAIDHYLEGVFSLVSTRPAGLLTTERPASVLSFGPC